ncbi:MAG: hypothetical protein ACI957_004681 [Verrucomicrobiales bacterium]|jgi:hypothetical protein
MNRLIIIPLVLGLAALGVAFSKPDPVKEVSNYTLHEWGIFTSVFGADGRMLAGLEREEEALPPFVYAHAGMRSKPGLKAMTRPVHNVTVKMETPVIYFYSDEGFKAHVDVGFHGGSISQWYPNRSSGEVPPTFKGDNFQSTAIDFAKGYEGSIAWDVEVLERSSENDRKPFVGTESTSWLYPRMTDANVVKNAEGAHEKYLFYRGLGNL